MDELKRLLASTTSLKQRAVLMTTYAAGLRVSEVVQLRPIDIESSPDRMLIRVNQGKGRKDRSTLLDEAAVAAVSDLSGLPIVIVLSSLS